MSDVYFANAEKKQRTGTADDPALRATHHYSGFDLAHDTYNALSAASDGKIYYVLSSDSVERGGQMFCYDHKSNSIQFLADLTEICGEKGMKTIPQGKSHVEFYEYKGKLFFATHVGHYEIIDGMERLPQNFAKGFAAYTGGHFLSYDLSTGEFQDLCTVQGEGILSMVMDQQRGQIFAISWPCGNLLHYDIHTSKLVNLGPISASGEAGMPGKDYRVLCRSMFVDQREGSVFFSDSEGNIFSYEPTQTRFRKLDDINLRLDYFGTYDPKMPGSMGYNWRKIFWHPEEEVAYGVHGNSGYLFRFDPRNSKIEIVERITSVPSRKSGMFDQFSYGYLGFQLGPDKETIYYLTGGPVFENGKRIQGEEKISKGAARGLENLHLVTYHLPTDGYRDHGPVFYEDGSRPTYVNSIAVADDGRVYMLARFTHNGKVIQDLVKIDPPVLTLKSNLTTPQVLK
jgi:hypothetical protein